MPYAETASPATAGSAAGEAAAHREAALATLRKIPHGTASLPLLNEPGPVGFCVATASVAALHLNRQYVPTPEMMRLVLVRQMRLAESRATGSPAHERVRDVSDDDALTFLATLYDEGYARTIPRNPSERAW